MYQAAGGNGCGVAEAASNLLSRHRGRVGDVARQVRGGIFTPYIDS